MAAQRGRSREAVRALDLTVGGNALGDLAGRRGAATAFIGYEHGPLRAQASVLAILRNGESVGSASAGAAHAPCVSPACKAYVPGVHALLVHCLCCASGAGSACMQGAAAEGPLLGP